MRAASPPPPPDFGGRPACLPALPMTKREKEVVVLLVAHLNRERLAQRTSSSSIKQVRCIWYGFRHFCIQLNPKKISADL
jgi:hypothetical protein